MLLNTDKFILVKWHLKINFQWFDKRPGVNSSLNMYYLGTLIQLYKFSNDIKF